MPPRGVSAEEKRVRLLEIFHESRDFYQLKELEKLGPKLKGIGMEPRRQEMDSTLTSLVSQSVKDVLQGLVDDGLVQGEKIGASNFFWSFPSQQGVLAQSRLDTAVQTRNTYKTQIEEIKRELEYERHAREEKEERAVLLARLLSLKKQEEELNAELNAYGDSNPAKLEEAKRAAFLAKEAACRWTGYFTRQHGVGAEEVRQFVGVGEDYEDIE